MKLTEKQKLVIKKMREGYKFQTSFSRPMLFRNGITIYVSYSVADKLTDLNLLNMQESRMENSLMWSLTETGKTIEL